jgi:hypothetical protein
LDYAGYIRRRVRCRRRQGVLAAGLVEDKAVALEVRFLTRTQAEDGFWKEERFTATVPGSFFCAIAATRNRAQCVDEALDESALAPK